METSFVHEHSEKAQISRILILSFLGKRSVIDSLLKATHVFVTEMVMLERCPACENGRCLLQLALLPMIHDCEEIEYLRLHGRSKFYEIGH